MRIRKLLSISLLISVLLHITTIIILKVSTVNQNSEIQDKPLEITILESQSLTPLQIVEQDEKPVNYEIDQQAKYLSQFNQKVVNETRAQNSGKFNNSGGRGVAKGEAKKSKASQQMIEGPTVKGGSPLDKFKPQVDWSKMAERNHGGDGLDVSRSSDYLKELDQGPQTVLSTREFLYYTYFKRIKGRIQQYWEPSIKKKIEKMVSQGRQLASVQDRITKLLIVLDNNGTLIKVQILSESGVHDLDDAAIEAFKSAAPFPNPPSGIIEADGTIKIRWDFVLEA